MDHETAVWRVGDEVPTDRSGSKRSFSRNVHSVVFTVSAVSTVSMELIRAVWAVGVLLCLGLGLARHALLAGPDWTRTGPFLCAWAWGSGTATAGALLCWTTWISEEFSIIPVYGLVGLVWIWPKGAPEPPPQIATLHMNPARPLAGRASRWVFVALVLLMVVLTLDRTGGRLEWDGWAVWEIKARAIYLENRLDTVVMRDLSRFGFAHPDYPPLLPLLETFVYRHLQRTDERLLGPLHAAWGWSVALIVLGLARRRLPDPFGPALTLAVMASGPILRGIVGGLADVPLLGYNLMILVLLERPRPGVGLGLAVLGALLVKNEGRVTFGATALALILTKAEDASSKSRRIGSLVLPLILFIPWIWLMNRWHLSVDLLAGGTAPIAEWPARLSVLGCSTLSRCLDPTKVAGPVWIAIALWIARPPAWGPAFLFCSFLGPGLMVPYVVSQKDLCWLINTSLDRVLMQFVPVAMLVFRSCPDRRDGGALVCG